MRTYPREHTEEEVGGGRRLLAGAGVFGVVVVVVVVGPAADTAVAAAAIKKDGSLLRLPFLTSAPDLAELHAAPPRGATGRGICGCEAAEAAPGGVGM